MEIRVLQSLIDRNANEIADWELRKEALKHRLRISENYYKPALANDISSVQKKIKKLVEIQVALKGEIAAMMSIMRIENELKKWAAKHDI